MRLIVLVLVIAIVSILDHRGLLISSPPDTTWYHDRQVEVIRVIDGDTFEVLHVGRVTRGPKVTRVRIWGIDTPEAARYHPDPQPAEPWANEATAFARSRLDGTRVLLRIEPHRTRDTYGRLLAHVYLPTGENFAELLLAQGLAHADDRWDHEFRERYRMVETQARAEQQGLWSP